MSSGLVLIDKPQGFTSHDVVAKMRGIAGTRRVGHAGTLDPMATGLLILGINAGTKLLTFIVGEDKTYEATIRLGAGTITDDAEGDVSSVAEPGALAEVDEPKILAAVEKLRGDILQVPSSVSAIKVDGKRAYAKVRAGDEVKLAARPVRVSKFELTSVLRRVESDSANFIDIDVIVDCSSGTYIRALARDLGQALGVGGHLTVLRRTRIANYGISSAQQLNGLTRETLRVQSMVDAASGAFEMLELTEQQQIDIRHGKRIAASTSSENRIAATFQGELVAILEKAGHQLKSTVVFAKDSDA